MANGATLQTGYAQKSVVNIKDSQCYCSRYVYNTNIDVLNVKKAYNAPPFTVETVAM